MTAVLGISGLYHDAAAALVIDDRVVAAIQEERLTRIKNDAKLPWRAARACLQFAGISAHELDNVVFYENPFAKLERVLTHALRAFPRGVRGFPRAMQSQLGEKIWVLDAIANELDVPRARVLFGEHHRSHAASAFYASPFDAACVLTVDGVGESVTTAIFRADDTGLHCLDELHFPHSLGLLYAALTAYLGFEVNEGEHKVMGLAAFGTSRFEDEFAKIVKLQADGSYELVSDYFGHEQGSELGFSSALETLLGPRRLPGRRFGLPLSTDEQRYADIAATLQAVTERALLGLCQRARSRTGLSHLCLAGGVALNAVANARIARESGFSRVFVQPAAGDAGGALGAALLRARELGAKRPAALGSAGLGLPINPAQAHDLAIELGFSLTRVTNPAREAAALLARHKLVGLCSGRFEWGPRALGQRSLLAEPSDPETRERLNRVVKQREAFQPFAPSVLAARAERYFEGAPNHMTPYMTTVCPVRPTVAQELAAVRHVDGTARVQTVEATHAPLLHATLEEFASLSGTPVLLNTSLNGAHEPIVASSEDALGFLMAHELDALLVEDLLIKKGPL
ncbi:MAG: carbamoyltransferase [Myxococcota bacterium]